MKIKLENINITCKLGTFSSENRRGDDRKAQDKLDNFELGFGLGSMEIELEPRELPELVKEAASVIKAEAELKKAERSEEECEAN